jgi:hypothetical protein
MPHTMLILGAGASADAGAPVMSNFFDIAESLLPAPAIEPHRQDFERVFDGIYRLQPVFAKSYIDTRNLEAVFVAFEMAELVGRLGDAAGGLGQFVSSLRNVIVRTLEETIAFPSTKSGSAVAPPSYAILSEGIERMMFTLSDPPGTVTVVTFNYDCALDLALAQRGISIDYGLEETPVAGAVALLKLHGSLNWAGRSSGQIYAHEVQLAALQPGPPATSSWRLRTTDAAVAEAKRAPGSQKVQPVIVPPTMSKGRHHKRLARVWRRTAQALHTADTIIIAGYSLTTADYFFRYLFALGTMGRTRIKDIIVCDIAPSKELDERYRALLGPLALDRYTLVGIPFEVVARAAQAGDVNLLVDSLKSHAAGPR